MMSTTSRYMGALKSLTARSAHRWHAPTLTSVVWQLPPTLLLSSKISSVCP